MLCGTMVINNQKMIDPSDTEAKYDNVLLSLANLCDNRKKKTPFSSSLYYEIRQKQ